MSQVIVHKVDQRISKSEYLYRKPELILRQIVNGIPNDFLKDDGHRRSDAYAFVIVPCEEQTAKKEVAN